MEWTKKDFEIKSRIHDAISLLGGESDILGTINSWKRTLPGEEILICLNSWIDYQQNPIPIEQDQETQQ